ncbi:hypothetical protein AVEN_160839-1 [Araneus ventricosus]|uniref:Uncharacterized protein n=1 Tax=Araneus ventricosus TaxID=182803 RepID=A0A4Y2M9F9_ARAVE|nr:hypothetical protein AVEN_160839-1 [Araneus ventricosus]
MVPSLRLPSSTFQLLNSIPQITEEKIKMKLLFNNVVVCNVPPYCEKSAGYDTSVEYLRKATNDNSSNDFLRQHDIFKNINDWMKDKLKQDMKNKIFNFKDNSVYGSGIGGDHYIGRIRVKDPKNKKWAFLGIGLILFVKFGLLWYRCQRNIKKRDTKCEVQHFSKK